MELSEGHGSTQKRGVWICLALAVVLVQVGIGTAWIFRVRAANPTLRPVATWTQQDMTRLFHDPDNHWCNGNHGHVSGKGVSLGCKGRVARVMGQLEITHRNAPWAEDTLITLLRHPNPDVASRAAESLGHWKSTRTLGPLTERLGELLLEANADPMTVKCVAWALGHMEDQAALPLLRAVSKRYTGSSATGWIPSAIQSIESGHTCAKFCGSPYRK